MNKSEKLHLMLEYAEYEVSDRIKLVIDNRENSDVKLLYVVTDYFFKKVKKPIGIIDAIKKYDLDSKDPELNKFLNDFKR